MNLFKRNNLHVRFFVAILGKILFNGCCRIFFDGRKMFRESFIYRSGSLTNILGTIFTISILFFTSYTIITFADKQFKLDTIGIFSLVEDETIELAKAGDILHILQVTLLQCLKPFLDLSDFRIDISFGN